MTASVAAVIASVAALLAAPALKRAAPADLVALAQVPIPIPLRAVTLANGRNSCSHLESEMAARVFPLALDFSCDFRFEPSSSYPSLDVLLSPFLPHGEHCILCH